MALSRQLRGLRRPLTDLGPLRPASLVPFASWTLHAPSALASYPASRASSVPMSTDTRCRVRASAPTSSAQQRVQYHSPACRSRNSRPRITAELTEGSPLIRPVTAPRSLSPLDAPAEALDGSEALHLRRLRPHGVAYLARTADLRLVAGRDGLLRRHEDRHPVHGSRVDVHRLGPAIRAVPLARLPIEKLHRHGRLETQGLLSGHWRGP